MKTYKAHSTLVIQLSGLLDSNKANQLYQQVVDSEQVEVIIIDIKDVTLIDKNGFEALSNSSKQAEANNIQLFVCSRKTEASFNQVYSSNSHYLLDRMEFYSSDLGGNYSGKQVA